MSALQIPFKAYNGEESYIFVSYAHANKAMVFPLIKQLRDKGYRIWYDEGIDPGTEWADNIETHLDGAAVMLLFITSQSIASENVKDEIHYAIDEKIPIIPVFLEETELTGGLKLRLKRYQWVHYFSWPNEKQFFEELMRSPYLKNCSGTKEMFDKLEFGGLKWIVLENKDGKLLIVTDDIIELRRFNATRDDKSWENSELRKYLNDKNNGFLKRFQPEELQRIDKSSADLVFLLGIPELRKLFPTDKSRIAAYNGVPNWWWTPNLCGHYGDLACVEADGKEEHFDGYAVTDSKGGVRPALWLQSGECHVASNATCEHAYEYRDIAKSEITIETVERDECNFEPIQGQCQERCKICGKTRELHQWKDCKCILCGTTRDFQHFFEDVPNSCTRKCAICGKIQSLYHQGNECRCKRCGEILYTGHVWESIDNCKKRCNKCGTLAYDHFYEYTGYPGEKYDGQDNYKCSKCGHEGYQLKRIIGSEGWICEDDTRQTGII